MDLRRFWILLLLFTVTNCLAETFPDFKKSITSKYAQESVVTHPLKVSDLQYGLNNPFNSTNLVSDVVQNIHFDQNNNYKKIQVFGSSHHRSVQIKTLYLTFQKDAYHLCMIKLNDAFFCKFQI